MLVRSCIALSMLLMIGALSALYMPDANAAGTQLVVIVSVSSPLKNISTGMLRRAFQGELAEYTSGKRLIPINHPPGTATRAQFDRSILDLKPAEVGRFWVDRRIRDQSGPPKTVPSVDLALRLTMSLPGVVTYVTKDLLNDKVRALSIDGKAVGQPGYLLSQ